MDWLKNLLQAKFLKGRRTKYISFTLIFILGGLQAAGVIDADLVAKITPVLVGLGLITAADHEA